MNNESNEFAQAPLKRGALFLSIVLSVLSGFLLGLSLGNIGFASLNANVLYELFGKTAIFLICYIFVAKSIWLKTLLLSSVALAAALYILLNHDEYSFGVPHESAGLFHDCSLIEKSILCRETDFISRFAFSLRCLNLDLLDNVTDVKAAVCSEGVETVPVTTY